MLQAPKVVFSGKALAGNRQRNIPEQGGKVRREAGAPAANKPTSLINRKTIQVFPVILDTLYALQCVTWCFELAR